MPASVYDFFRKDDFDPALVGTVYPENDHWDTVLVCLPNDIESKSGRGCVGIPTNPDKETRQRQ